MLNTIVNMHLHGISRRLADCSSWFQQSVRGSHRLALIPSVIALLFRPSHGESIGYESTDGDCEAAIRWVRYRVFRRQWLSISLALTVIWKLVADGPD